MQQTKKKPKDDRRYALKIHQGLADRLTTIRDCHMVSNRIILEAMLTHFEGLHVDWQAAMLRGEKLPHPK